MFRVRDLDQRDSAEGRKYREVMLLLFWRTSVPVIIAGMTDVQVGQICTVPGWHLQHRSAKYGI